MLTQEAALWHLKRVNKGERDALCLLRYGVSYEDALKDPTKILLEFQRPIDDIREELDEIARKAELEEEAYAGLSDEARLVALRLSIGFTSASQSASGTSTPYELASASGSTTSFQLVLGREIGARSEAGSGRDELLRAASLSGSIRSQLSAAESTQSTEGKGKTESRRWLDRHKKCRKAGYESHAVMYAENDKYRQNCEMADIPPTPPDWFTPDKEYPLGERAPEIPDLPKLSPEEEQAREDLPATGKPQHTVDLESEESGVGIIIADDAPDPEASTDMAVVPEDDNGRRSEE